MFPQYAECAQSSSHIGFSYGQWNMSAYPNKTQQDLHLENSNVPAAVPSSGFDDNFFFENVNDAIFIHDLAGNLLKVNQVACQRLGYAYDELIQIKVSQLESPENASIYADRIRELEQKGNLVLESRLRRKNGEFIPVEVNARLFQYHGSMAVLSVIRDITERKRAEEELRQQTEKLAISQEQTVRALELLETLLANAPIGICFYDTELRYLDINPCLAQMNGISVAESIGRFIWDIVPGLAPAIEPLLKIVLATGQPVLNVEIEGRVPIAPGQTGYRLVSYYPVRDSLGNIQGIGGIVKDITQIKQAEKALQHAEEKYRSIFENAVEGIFQSTPEGRYLSVNSAMTRIFGYASPEEMMVSIRSDIEHKIYADPGRRVEFMRILEEHGIVKNFEAPNLRKDGTVIWTSTNARAVRDNAGTLLYYEGFVEDVTQHKQGEEALRDSEARYRMLLEQAVDGIAVINVQGKYLDVNSTGCALLGYTREEFLGKPVADVLAPHSLDQAPVPFDALREGKTVVLERMMQRKDGTLFPVEVRTKMLPDGTFQGIFRDISDRKHLESAIQAMLDAQREWNADLEDKVRAKTSELEQLAKTRDQLLRQIIVAQEEEHRRVARELHDETSQALTALIANLAVVQGLPASKAKLHLDEVKASVVEILKGVNQIVLDLRPTLLDDYGLMPALSWYATKRLGSSVRIEMTSPEPELRLPPTIETTLFRVGQEALANVTKHAQASWVRVRLDYAEKENRITLQVSDNGIGFSMDRVKQGNTEERPHLGLLGMQERMQLIGGQLRIESDPGKGTLISASVILSEHVVEEKK
jgi:PAS domain S-box-containing protein